MAEKLAADVNDTVLYPVSCAVSSWDEKELLLMLTFFMRRPTTLWGFQPSCLRRFLFAHGSLAGLPMSWNNVRTIGSFVQVRTTLAPTRGRLCLSLIGKHGNHRLRSTGVNGAGERERYRPSGCGRCGSCWLGEWSSH